MYIHRLFLKNNVTSFKYLAQRYASHKLGSVALVTGATSGIGLEMCKKLLKAGVRNIIMSSSSEKGEKVALKLRKLNRDACLCYCKCDVAKRKEMENLFDQALSMHGHLDIVVNNAGIFNDTDWKKQIAVNCSGVVYGTKLALGCMSKQKGGKGGAIVNTASILGMQPLAGAPVYAATKYFVIGLTKSYGMDYHYNTSSVRVMAICPGITLTPLIEKANEDTCSMAKHAAKELDAMKKQQPCFVGKALIKVLRKGETGSIWVAEAEEVYEVEIPDREEFRI